MGTAQGLVGASLTLMLAGCGPSTSASGRQQRVFHHTFPNDQGAFDYFLGKGLSAAQAAGIVGNLDQESGVDPQCQQSPTGCVYQGGGPGIGIAQWEQGGRWDTNDNDNVLAFASQQGRSPTDLGLQLDFIWYELTTFSNYGYGELQGDSDVEGATLTFMTAFEGCGQCDQSNRIAYAQDVLAAYGSDAPGGPPPPPPPPPGGGGGGGADACSGLDDGLYCGNDPSYGGGNGDPNTLYQCVDQVTQPNPQYCPGGCSIGAGSQDDFCSQSAPPPPPPGGSGGADACSGLDDGFYCGNDPSYGGGNSDPNTLYQCVGQVTQPNPQYCASGCSIGAGSQDDYCN